MQCEQCGYFFPIYKFAYRQIRRCPQCGKMYEMHFPTGTGFFSVVLAMLITIFMPVKNSNIMVDVSIFILVFYLLNILIKIILIYQERYTIDEYHQ